MATQSAWTDELKAKVIEMYEQAGPMSPNGVRMVLVQAGVYVKKDPSAGSAKTTKTASGEGSKRVSKETSIAELKAAIESRGGPIDDDILGKLTGKAAVYFTQVLKAA